MERDDYKINVFHTHIEINRYNLGDKPKLEDMLSVWDDSIYKKVPIGYTYNEELKRLYIPRGCDVSILERMFGYSANIIYIPDEYDEISMRMLVPPRDDEQRESIAFLIGDGKFTYTKRFSQLSLNLGTGVGKTYVTTAAMSFFRLKTMIITHTNEIKSQWLDTLTTKTDLDEANICNISSSARIDKLLNTKYNKLKYKVYLVNHGTILSYANSNGWESIRELFIHLRIGLKVMDEAHLFFANMLKIDQFSNCKKSIYLTATFDRSNRFEKYLFKLATSSMTRFGVEKQQEHRKHIMYLAVMYNSCPPLDIQSHMYTMRKFNKNRYASYLISSSKFFVVLEYLVGRMIHKEGKMLLLSTTIESCEVIHDFIKDKFPNKTVSMFHSKIPKKEKTQSWDADIICSTPASCGVGKDIPKLRTIINTEAYSSSVTADQVAGRLREYSETENTYYIELVDRGFKSVYEMYKRRLPTLKKKCLSINTLDYDRENI